MSQQSDPVTDFDISAITLNQARTALQGLLRLPRDGSENSVDRLIAVLAARNGQPWFDAALERLSTHASVSVADTLLAVDTPLDRLQELKEDSKRLAKDPQEDEAFLLGMLGYFLTLAAALAHHRILLSSRERPEVDEVLAALSDAVVPPWKDLVVEALATPRAPDDRGQS